jgi:hypothetical protein
MEHESDDNREGRIRSALGLARGPLPHVERQWLHVYHEFLAARLSLPFAAQYTGDLARLRQTIPQVTVIALIDPGECGESEGDGLVCFAQDDKEQLRLALVDIEVDVDHANFQLLDDYWYWFWNWRFDASI